MSEVSKEVNKRRRGRPRQFVRPQHRILLSIDDDKFELIRRAADSVQEPVVGWIRRAIFTALRKWELPTVRSDLYEPCSVCGKKHDRNEHFRDGSDVAETPSVRQ